MKRGIGPKGFSTLNPDYRILRYPIGPSGLRKRASTGALLAFPRAVLDQDIALSIVGLCRNGNFITPGSLPFPSG